MNLEIAEIKSGDNQISNLFLGGQNAVGPKQSSVSDGARFPTIPSWKQFTATTAVVAVVGTAPLLATPRTEPVQMNISIRRDNGGEAVRRRYEKLRADIEASGEAMLTDDELRAEIASRRGIR